jgi:thioredoxin 2
MGRQNIIAKCSQCGVKNRVPISRANERPVCGRCRALLSLEEGYPDYPVPITDGSFAREILGHRGAAVTYVWGPWCGHCQRLSPLIDQFAADYAGKIKFTKMVQDQNPVTASRYNIQGVPTLLLFRSGNLVNRLVGALPRAEMEQHLRSLL